jgi:hypothetical protein
LIGLWWIDRLAVAVTVSDGDGDGMAVLFEEAMYTLWISELRGLHNMNVAGLCASINIEYDRILLVDRKDILPPGVVIV